MEEADEEGKRRSEGLEGASPRQRVKPKGLKPRDSIKERAKKDRRVDASGAGQRIVNPVTVKARSASRLISSFSLIFRRGESPFRRVSAAPPAFSLPAFLSSMSICSRPRSALSLLCPARVRNGRFPEKEREIASRPEYIIEKDDVSFEKKRKYSMGGLVDKDNEAHGHLSTPRMNRISRSERERVLLAKWNIYVTVYGECNERFLKGST